MRWTPIIDSHVHLAYWPVADELARRGVAAVVDLGSPAPVTSDALFVISAGPMLTRPAGYPLDSWGADGYGVGCSDAACIERAVRGAIVKIAVDDGGLDAALVDDAVRVAHARGLRVAVHALSDRGARLAADAGADVLAHTPVEPLHPATINAWRGRAVVSTLAALRAAGVTVLYGTDLGNLRDAGPSEAEVALLRRASTTRRSPTR